MKLAELERSQTMQLATERNGQPWVCTVYFVLHVGSLYWLSLPERRHSIELQTNSRAAAAIAIKHDKPVVGVQVEGDVAVITDSEEAKRVLGKYVAKYGQGGQFVERFLAGENQHVLYRLTPRRVMKFDELSDPKEPYQEISFV